VFPNVTIEVKLFEVPSTPAQKLIPYARVNHNKYMVTDKSAYIGTSNWSGDYFTDTAGVGFIVTPKDQSQNGNSSSYGGVDNSSSSEVNFRSDLAQIFERDWNSSYALPLDEVMTEFREFSTEDDEMQEESSSSDEKTREFK